MQSNKVAAAPPGNGHKVGDALKAIRNAADMTLQAVVDEAGVSLSYLSRVENGLVTPTPGWVEHVAITIGTHMADKARAGAKVRAAS